MCGFLAISALAIYSVSGFLDIPNEAAQSIQTTVPSLADPPLRIASFNIQVLGQSKYSKLDVRNALIKVCKCSLLLFSPVETARCWHFNIY